MAYLIGALIGGLLIGTLISLILEKFLYKDLPPVRRAAFTVGTSWFFMAILSGWGAADGGSFVPTQGLFYLPSALVIFFWFQHRYRQLWED